MMKPLHLLGMNAAFAALLIFAAAEASDAQRRGGGGGSRQVRASSSGSISGANRAASRDVNRGTNRDANRDINVNRDVNINRDVDIDVDHDNGWGDIDHPIAAGAAIAATTAIVVGSYYSSLPSGCMKVIEAGATYYTCNGYWYQPVYKGNSVTYVVVNQP